MANERIEFAQAKQTGQEIKAIADNINALLGKVSIEMEKVGGEAWQSARATNFKNNFELLKASFNKVYSAISTMGEAIDNSAKLYESNEGIGM